MKKKENWYQNIEPAVRKLVYLLRNNGFNTTCSCGHEMTIELTLGNHLDEVERLANFLVENNIKGFRIDINLFDKVFPMRIYLTILLVLFTALTYFQSLYVIPLCITSLCISVELLQGLFKKGTKLAELEEKLKEVSNIANACRITLNNRTRK